MSEIRGTWEYVPYGGMVLTAGEKAGIWQEGYDFGVNDERLSQEVTGGEVAPSRGNPYAVSSLFPATEPAEGPRELICPCRGRFGFHDCNTVAAPAEPAEEETKAEELQEELEDLTVAYEAAATVRDEAVSLSYWLAQQLGEHVDDADDRGETLTDTVQRLIEHIRPNLGKTKIASSPVAGEETRVETHIEKSVRKGALAKLLERTLIADGGWHLPTGWDPGVLASAIVHGVTVTGSPVVPTPGETGPWQSIEDVPVGVEFMDREGSELVKLADGTFGYLNGLRETGLTMAEFAPFVAAVKG